MLVSPAYTKAKPRIGTRFDAYAPLARGLVAQYCCNDGGATLYNSAAIKLNTPLSGSPVFTAGKYGPALKLNGTSQYGGLPVTGTGLSGWSGTGISVAIAFQIVGSPVANARLWEKGNNSEICLTVNFGGSDTKLALQKLGSSASGVTSSANYGDGKTHIAHVTVTTGLVATLYADGSSLGTNSAGTPLSYTNDCQIGRYILGSHFFPGLVEGFWAWNRPLSAQEVQSARSLDPFCMFESKRRLRLFAHSATTIFRRTQFDRAGSRGAV